MNPCLLLVDDDAVFSAALARALTRRGFEVAIAANAQAALRQAEAAPPQCAVIDLKLGDGSGLELVAHLKRLNSRLRIVVLTGYASIATAVEAIKLGATHYLAKPADADQIVAALHKQEGDAATPLAEQPLSVARFEWEHIQRVLTANQGNISATARSLNMHRRTLQRKLAKRPHR